MLENLSALETERIETLRLLLEKKFDVVTQIADSSMLWWVSATVLFSAIIGAVMQYQGSLKDYRHWQRVTLFILVLSFFLLTVAFGIFVTHMTFRLDEDVKTLTAMLRVSPDIRTLEFHHVGLAISIFGTTSFAILTAAWCVFAAYLCRKNPDSASDKDGQHNSSGSQQTPVTKASNARTAGPLNTASQAT